MGKKLNDLILGSLLHDVGKLAQRADGAYIRHSNYGYDYLKKLNFNNVEDIENCIKYHHGRELGAANLKEDDIAYIVYEADNIAAGLDRRQSDEEDENKESKQNKGLYTPLKSIFDVLNKDKGMQGPSCYLLRSLKEDQNINYPTDTENQEAIKAEYLKRKQELEKGLKEMVDDQPNSLLQLLEATMSYIPSDTFTSMPDISLYDHSKLTAAIASCMYLYFKDNNNNNYKSTCLTNAKREDKYFMLVSGDLSGVQDFIYTIASKGALKSLRARSFYLDLLLEHISDEILEKLNLSRANLIYTGGGHFYMLLPNTKDSKTTLENAKVTINEWFLNNFGTELYLALGYEECSSNELMDPEVKSEKSEKAERKGLTREVFRRVSKKLSKDKLNRYEKGQLKAILNHDSPYNQMIDDGRECSVCHTSKKQINTDDRLGETCNSCLNLFEMGKNLVFKKNNDDEVRIMSIRNKIPESNKYMELPSLDDSKRFLVVEKYGEVKNRLNVNNNDYKRIYTKNKWMSGLSLSTNLWMGDYNKKPERKENAVDKEGKPREGLIDFDEMASKSNGIKRLAVMRADVDNLGAAFLCGFENKYSTLSRYTTLSRQLSLFFKHYINRICKSNITGEDKNSTEAFSISNTSRLGDKVDKNLVIVYSGGDDIFIVGAWNDVLDFAVDLRRAFKKFTRDKLKFSAGIGFFSDSFPIYQMAHLTGKLEEEAKAYPDNDDPTKNAVALFGLDKSIHNKDNNNDLNHVYSWDDFENSVYPKIEYFLKEFHKPTKNNEIGEFKLSTSFLYKLLVLLKTEIQEGKYSINLARLAYTMARIESGTKDEKKKEQLKNFKEKIYTWASNPKDRKELLTAVNLLVYMFRDKTKVEV